MTFIDLLEDILPILEHPTHVPSDNEIEAAEETFSLKFQDGFKEFMKIYGQGIVYNTFRILSIGSPGYISQIEYYRSLYSIYQGADPESYHLKLWPHAPGLFPLGSSTDGGMLFWMVGEGHRVSGLIIFEPKSPRYFYYDYELTAFLYNCIAGDFQYIHRDFLSSSEPFVAWRDN